MALLVRTPELLTEGNMKVFNKQSKTEIMQINLPQYIKVNKSIKLKREKLSRKQKINPKAARNGCCRTAFIYKI